MEINESDLFFAVHENQEPQPYYHIDSGNEECYVIHQPGSLNHLQSTPGDPVP